MLQKQYNSMNEKIEPINAVETDEFSTITEGNKRPDRIPENWVVNPHNNIDPEFAK